MSKLPDIKQNFPEWYHEVIYQAELVDQAPVRGCMVVRPYGTALWENIKAVLDKKIKDTGHKNAMFPLLIPLSFLEKEAEHVEGFAPELAIVTHAGGEKLEEPYVIRPTSETMIHYMFAKWIKSWRDLPMKINQWANVMRWEKRTRPFLRTSEFFWQEGHTAHETLEEADQEVETMLNEYIDLAVSYLAIPVISGKKPESEKFAGAEKTFTFEGIMPDGKALQMGTSHLISQNFAKAFGMMFQSREGKQEYPFLTSWGASTRLIGALVMTHGDSKGLVLPPAVAPLQVVIVPIFRKGFDAQQVLGAAQQVADSLKGKASVFIDSDEHETPGAKFYKWELKGVPLRIEIGPRDVENKQAMFVDRLGMEKRSVSLEHISQEVVTTLDALQAELYKRAQERLKTMIRPGEKLAEFGSSLTDEGFAYQTGWCQRPECEQLLKEYKATIRCLLDQAVQKTCFNCDLPSICDVIVARAY
jgi:prolyl-tRNA synthetase